MSESNYKVADIAKLAGVSPATVSRVLNHPEQVKEETVLAIHAVMDSVGFPYNKETASSMDERSVILVSIPSYLNMFYSEVLQGIYASAEVHGFSVLSFQKAVTPANLNEYLLLLNNIHCAGLITLDPMNSELFKIVAATVPTVQCCEAVEDLQIPYVTIDDYASAKNAVKYLISSGCTDIALLNGPVRFKFARERQRGYEDALKEAGLPVSLSRIIQLADVNYSMGFSAASQLFNSDSLPDAIFCVSDFFAAAAINAAKRAHLSVPEDISIMGFDNTDAAIMSAPTISTVNQPKFQLGYMGCEMLHDLIVGGGSASRMRNMLLPTELVIRDSTK